eukprot:g37504.t1
MCLNVLGYYKPDLSSSLQMRSFPCELSLHRQCLLCLCLNHKNRQVYKVLRTRKRLFAPTNAAFAAAGVDLSDARAVNAILKYHMLGTQFLLKDFGAYQLLPTLMTDAGYVNLGPGMPQVVRLTASVSMHPVQLNWNVPGEAASTSTVSEADVLALNGVIHIVDKVLQ